MSFLSKPKEIMLSIALVREAGRRAGRRDPR
jgi:hypothetical protein